MEKVYIFGAHSRAQTLAGYLQYLHSNIAIEAFLYDNEERNPEIVGAARVMRIMEGTKLHTEYPVFIATRGIYHRHVLCRLRQIGFKKIYPVTVELDSWLRNAYMKKYFAGMGQAYIKIDMLSRNMPGGAYRLTETHACVYVATSMQDVPLKQPYILASYEREIRTGVACQKYSFLETTAITDATGDNISDKNRQFCELTALYWIWKHASEDIIGLVQYRRHFILPGDWVLRMEANDVDVILPVPLYVAPSISGNYKIRHDPSDWDALMAYLKWQNTEEYQEAEAFFQTNLYSPCNMFIMRRQVLDELCGWMFPILFALAEQGGQKKDSYQNRYPGFLSERLITFFFERHRSMYKIVYCDKNFLE